MSSPLEAAVADHYHRDDLYEDILAGLRAAGIEPEAATPEDLAPVDEFHTAGRNTTVHAAEMLSPGVGDHVLDAGCGLGGTARCLASQHDCTVTGVDLTHHYVEVARRLTELTGLGHRCRFEQGSVLAMPFEAATFDAAVSMHVAMNVSDREGMYAELGRVVKPGGRLCCFDVMKGPTEGMRYPVPWAEAESTSFLKTCDETLTLLEAAGFGDAEVRNWRTEAVAFFTRMLAAVASGPPPLGLHLLTGANTRDKFRNFAAAIEAHEVEPVFVCVTRTG